MRGPQHEFCAKMKFPAQKNKNSSVNGTTSLAVIVGPKCLIAHLLAPHDRAFSLGYEGLRGWVSQGSTLHFFGGYGGYLQSLSLLVLFAHGLLEKTIL